MEIQLTFENIGLLNETQLQRLSDEFGNGYGGYTPSDIFERLIPQGYSMEFIKELMSCRYLCMFEDGDDKRFSEAFEEYKKSPIVEWEHELCKSCGHKTKTICKHYERTGKFLDQKGRMIEIHSF